MVDMRSIRSILLTSSPCDCIFPSISPTAVVSGNFARPGNIKGMSRFSALPSTLYSTSKWPWGMPRVLNMDSSSCSILPCLGTMNDWDAGSYIFARQSCIGFWRLVHMIFNIGNMPISTAAFLWSSLKWGYCLVRQKWDRLLCTGWKENKQGKIATSNWMKLPLVSKYD